MTTTVAEHWDHIVDIDDVRNGMADCRKCGYPFDRGDIALATDADGYELYCGCGCLPRYDTDDTDDTDTDDTDDTDVSWVEDDIDHECPYESPTDDTDDTDTDTDTDTPTSNGPYTIALGADDTGKTTYDYDWPVIQPKREPTIWENARNQGLTVTQSRGRYWVPMPDRVSDKHLTITDHNGNVHGVAQPRPPYGLTTLLTRDTASPKLAKSIGAVDTEIRGRILYLAPARSAGIGNICEHHGACVKDCLGPHSGRGRMHKTQECRVARTRFLAADRDAFCGQLLSELDTFEATCTRLGAIAGIRLDGTSDLDWRSICPKAYHDHRPRSCDWINYGYTKDLDKYHESRLCLDTTISGQYPAWYLTFSRDVHNDAIAHNIVGAGGNSAIVVRTKDMLRQLLKTGYRGYPCIDGDIHDWRFLDPAGHYVVLSAKGSAKRSTTGFVLDV